MKTFKTYQSAHKAAAGLPVLEVKIGKDRVYIPCSGSTDYVSIVHDGKFCGEVCLGHLDRLGNANHAIAAPNQNHATGFDLRGLMEPPYDLVRRKAS